MIVGKCGQMANKWDILAPVYDLILNKDKKAYHRMYEQIRHDIAGKEVLELATGTGLIAIHTAEASKSYVATDFSEKMILQAKKKQAPSHCLFEVADALNLPYEDGRFEVAIISNALHIMPNSERALREIARVVKADGVLIAPNFLWSNVRPIAKWLTRIMQGAGIRPFHRFDEVSYRNFLWENGWELRWSVVWEATFPLMYARCTKRGSSAD